MNEQQAKPKRKISVQTVLGGIALLVIVVIIVLMIMGPIVGNVFSVVHERA